MNIQDFRKQYGYSDLLTDASVLDLVHEEFYANEDKARLARALGVKIEAAQIPERSMLRGMGDLGLSVGQGAVGAVKSLTDLAGADNAVSQGLGSMSDYLQEQKSEQSKAVMAASQASIKEAEATGDWKSQTSAYLNMLWDQPGEMLAQGVGSFAPMLVAGPLAASAKLASAAKAAGMSKEAFLATEAGAAAVKAAADLAFRANIGVGAAQGIGAVKGSQYEQTLNAAKAQGMGEEEARALATEAQAYGGSGTMQQLLGGALGAGAAATGPIERMVAGRAGQAGQGVMARMGQGALTEAVPEGIQGGQERYAGNAAAIDAGVLGEDARWQGVVGQGLMEGAIGGVLGGGAGAFNGSAGVPGSDPADIAAKAQADALRATKPQGDGPLSKAVGAGIEAEAQKVEAAGARMLSIQSALSQDEVPTQEVAQTTPPDGLAILNARREAEIQAGRAAESPDDEILQSIGFGANTLPAQSEAQIDNTMTRMAQADAATVDRAPRARSDAIDLTLPTADPVRDYVDNLRQVNTPAAKFYVGEFDVGRITPADVQQRMTAERGKTPDERLADAAAQAPKNTAQPGDILNPKGEPFKTLLSARLAAKKTPGDVIEVVGGYSVRPRTEVTNAQATPVPASVQAVDQGAAPSVEPMPTPAQAEPVAAAVAGQPEQAQPLSPQDSRKLQEAHKALGYGVTRPQVQSMRDRVAQEVESGTTNNGGVVGKLTPIALKMRKAKLKRLDADLALFGNAPTAQAMQHPVPQQQAQPLKPAAQATTALGRNGVPVAEGGKPFKTKAEADTARKLQPMMRVKRDGNGFVLVEKTAAQIAAQEKAARRNLGSVGASGGPLSAHAFLASQGGLSKSTMADLGFDRNVRVGSKWLFTNTGMTLEGMTEALQQNGYVQGTEQNPAIEMVRRSANGQPQYTADGWDQIAQAEATARFEDHLAAQQDAMAEDEDFDPFSPDAIAGDFEGDDLVVAGYDAKQDPIKLEVNALLAKAEALGIDTDTIRETAYEDTKNESEQAYYERVRDELTRAINASTGSGSNQEADGNAQGGQGSDAQRGGRVDSRESNGHEGAPGTDGPAEGLTDDGIKIRPGKGLIKGKYLAEVDGVDLPGKPFDSEDEAYDAALKYREVLAQRAIEGADAQMRKSAIADKFRSGATVTAVEIESLGLKASTSDMRWFMSRAADLFGLNSRQIRPLVKDLIKIRRSDMGTEYEYVPTRKALEAIAASQNEGLTAYTPEEVTARQDAAKEAEATAKRAEEAAARAESAAKQASEIAQRSVAAADTFELGQDPLQNLTGQQDIFGAAADSAAPTAAPAVPARPTTIDKPATNAITTADVARATGEAKEAITSAIDAMPAQQAQKIAAGFFPSMGLPRVLGKKHIKATITDKPLNLLAAASEFGAELSPEIKAALQAEFEGKVEAVQVVAQAEATKLTQAEAADLMEWVALGTKDGVTKHVLVFYESKADKDANRGRMTVATITKGDRSANAFTIDGDDQRFGSLAIAKKRAMEIGMAKVIADGFVEAGEVAEKPVEKAAAKTEAQKPATVENFGEKLPPARRAMAAKLNEELSDDKISSMPLSQIWPAAENDAIEDTFAAAVAHVMRAEIPAKPRVAHRLKSWAGKVQLLRGFAANIVSGKVSQEKFLAEMGKLSSLRNMMSKIKLLEQIDRADWARIGDVSEAPNAVRYEDNKQIPTPSVSVTVDGRNHWLRGSGDIAFHLDGIKAMLGTAAPENKMQFDIRQESGGARKVFINKKGDKEYRRLMTFDTVAEARAAIQNQYADLVAAWEGVKARDNITERDVRSDVNRDRTGKDHRQGKDVSAEEFESQFGFRGGEFGSWVKQGDGAKERQFMLNNAYDALMDLSDLLGIPPKAISLEGSLGIAFGSRGAGWASAHFEPSNIVINLTKTRGAGSLAHEWFHALDNYFARKRGGEVMPKFAGPGTQTEYRNNNYITHKTTPLMVRKDGRGSPLTRERLQQWRSQSPSSSYLAEDQWQEDPKHKAGVRVEVEQAFNDLVAALNASPMLKRARVLDGVKESGDGYWSRTLEMAARSFENFVQTRMMEQGYHNDFLANVKAAPDVGKNTERYPYLMPNEIAPIAQAFDSLFGTIQSKETENGNVALYRTPFLSGLRGLPVTHDAVVKTVQSVLKGVPNAPQIEVHRTPADAGLNISGPMPKGGVLPDGRIVVFSDANTGVLDVMRTVFHELFHRGLKSYFATNADYVKFMLDLATKYPVVRKGVEEWKKSGDGQDKLAKYSKNGPMTGDRLANYEAIAVEESLATLSETLRAGSAFQLRAWTRSAGNLFEQVAKFFGMNRLADWIHGLNNTALDDFINAMIARSGDQPRGGSHIMLRSGRAPEPFSVKGATKAVVDRLGQNFSAPGKISWWDKTVGSMYHMAERYPAFKPVYEAAQNFINDVSYYGTEAANMAPRLLPKLDTWNDLMKSAISAADNDAVASPVFEGTLVWARDESGNLIKVDDLAAKYADLSTDQKARMLMRKNVISEAQMKAWKASPLDIYEGAIRNRFEESFLKAGVVFTDAELKAQFKLNDEQIALYKEFRAAADASLDNMTKADMLRIAGKDLADMRNDVMEADLDTAAAMVREKLLNLAREYPDREDVLTKAASDVLDRSAKAGELKLAGYAPLSRFGKYTVDVVVDGERKFFSLYESAADASRAAAQMRAEFGDGNVEQGTLSQREFELFQGITPESLELFGNMLGLDSTGDDAQDKAFQDYLRLTKSNRSALKRLIHRKGVDGYSEDVGRVLASFVYSNARQTAAALHIGDMGEAIAAIPKGDGELKDAAIELGKYVKEPREEAHALRGLLFAQYLGGSVASAMVNFTQPLAVSIPYLSQFGGIRKAAFAWRRAVSDMANGKELEPALAKAMKVAEEKGVVSPQEVHQLMAQARGAASLRSGDGTVAGDLKAAGQNSIAKMAVAWGKLFGFAEQINRRSTFIAAYRLAVDKGIADPAAFAEKAVNETQFVNNKGNKMKWGRGAIGATAMTFKSYSLNWLELMHRLATQNGTEGKWAAAYMLGALVLMSGAGGLPFAGDAEDVIDGIAQRLGYNFSSKKVKQQFLEDTFGKTAAGFIDKGITGIPGVPIDIAGRTGMGNLIPGTGLFLKKTDHTRDVMEFAGPAGDLITRGFTAADQLASGEPMKAAKTIAPKAVGNLIQGVDMANSGMYKDAKGYKMLDADMGEAIGKMIGFQPHSVANIQEAAYLEQRGKDFYNMHKQTINAKWANGIFTSDQAEIQEARDMVKAWNENNPDQRITVSMPIILKRVREMRKDKAQRIADTAPKAMRAAMREDLRRAATVD